MRELINSNIGPAPLEKLWLEFEAHVPYPTKTQDKFNTCAFHSYIECKFHSKKIVHKYTLTENLGEKSIDPPPSCQILDASKFVSLNW